MEPIIKFDKVSMVYGLGKSNEVKALNNISGQIEKEEYIIFFGPSGCGKSTLLYVIAGLEKPTSGSLIVNGHNLRNISQKELINFYQSTLGFVFQAYYLIPSLTVKENILLPYLFSGKKVKEVEDRADFLMKRFNIDQLRDKKPMQLSGGQQQRVAIARALIQNPPIILADEPVGNLDSVNAEIVLNLLDELHEKDKKTIIQVTHNPKDLERATHIFYMKDGQIIKEARNIKKKPAQVLSNQPMSSMATKASNLAISDIERLTQIYPHLTEKELQVKLIANYLLNSVNMETQQVIESIIKRYLAKELDENNLFHLLDKPIEQGGAGLYVQKAREFSDKIIELSKQSLDIEQKEEGFEVNIEKEKVVGLRQQLLDGVKAHLSFEQINRIDQAIAQRINNTFSKKKLEQALDLSFKKGGAGLDKRTAKKLTNKVEMILINKTLTGLK
ncbi:MAG: ABC transporter ATP-binding protein [Candidatus Pacebacteria bacterium]|nr:ABC transporter ATP-binding protein [Candidatus Paceibacterota bacterium]